MRPRVVMHTQISLDGCVKGFQESVSYYREAAEIPSDMVLFGSETVRLAAEQYPPETESSFHKPGTDPDDKRQNWVIPDSKGRLRNLHVFRNTEYCRDIILLVSASTPEEYLSYLTQREYDYIKTGDTQVDLREALEQLHERYGCKMVRTDSGGELTNALLEQGLVDEIRLILSPCLVGNRNLNVFRTMNLHTRVDLKQISCESHGEEISLRYEVIRP